jgi:hypothetical protein
MLTASDALTQSLSERGFVDVSGALYPQDASNDPTNAVVDFRTRGELFWQPAAWLQLAGGVDVRANTHDQVSSSWVPDLSDRGVLRPALSVRRLSATVNRDGLTVDLGRQFVRWGKADIVTPTDRFAPRDYLNVIDAEVLPVVGVRVTYQRGSEAFEAAWVPVFTPSRLPLLDQRWTVTARPDIPLAYAADQRLPTQDQFGVRWSHTGSGYEYAAMFFDGLNHLPNIEARVVAQPLEVEIVRHFPAIRTYGGDAAVSTRWFTLKSEAAYFDAVSAINDEYVLYVIQVERQTGEWLFTAGYAGEIVTFDGPDESFAPDRGTARSIVGRGSYNLDANQSLAFESAIKQTGDGVYVKGEYSMTTGQHWRTTVAGTLIAGSGDDFIGQYQRNDNITVNLRYSF